MEPRAASRQEQSESYRALSAFFATKGQFPLFLGNRGPIFPIARAGSGRSMYSRMVAETRLFTFTT